MKKIWLLNFLLVVFICAGVLFLFEIGAAAQVRRSASQARSVDTNGIQFETAIENVAADVGPGVVSIRTETVTTVGGDNLLFGAPGDDENLNNFFEHFFGQTPEFKEKQQGVGSGLIIEPDGYILTNEHVVANADQIKVTLISGREYDAELIGSDRRSDLAVIKIDAEDLPKASFGNSENLRIGQWVVAIGNPFAHLLPNPEPTVTVGVISALDRTIAGPYLSDAIYTALIQTDAAINPGNSGGPLLNLRGEVVGINVAIFSTTGGYQGIGFAIPIDTVKRITSKIIRGEEVEYGWIGVAIQNLDQNLAEYFGLKNPDGVLVHEVLVQGPASKAGIQKGDIILSVNQRRVRNVSELINLIGAITPGKIVSLRVFRNGSSRQVKVEVERNPVSNYQQEQRREEEEPAQFSILEQWRGLSIQDIPKSMTAEMGLESIEGVLVADVQVGSPADEAGIQPGSIILSVDSKDISNAKEFEDAVRNKKGDVLLRTNQAFVVVKSPQNNKK
ncbi:MAG: Do family serine endopeptidase [Candidatus Omnitrophota bacterium]